jgi:hypothetical protein
MNENGDVLFRENGYNDASIYTDGQTMALPSGVVGVRGINNDRVVTGWFTGDPGAYESYVYDSVTDVLTPIPADINAVAIGDDGTVIGSASRGARGFTGAATYSDDEGLTLLDDRGDKAPESQAKDVNQAGQILVWSDPEGRKGGVSTGFLYDPVDGIWSLDDLIVNDSQADLDRWLADSSNSLGNFVEALSEPTAAGFPYIIGRKKLPGSFFADGQSHESLFLLAPIAPAAAALAAGSVVPEPSTLILLALGLLLLPRRRR